MIEGEGTTLASSHSLPSLSVETLEMILTEALDTKPPKPAEKPVLNRRDAAQKVIQQATEDRNRREAEELQMDAEKKRKEYQHSCNELRKREYEELIENYKPELEMLKEQGRKNAQAKRLLRHCKADFGRECQE